MLFRSHQAHIQTHMAAIQNPRIQQMMQGNPAAQAILAAAMAHINEHVAFQYRLEVEQMIGATLPPMQEKGEEHEPVAPEVADQIAVLAAQATQALLQRDQQAAQQQQAQQQMQDPIVQMQMQELQLRQQDLQLKAQKQQIEAAAKADQIRVEEERIKAQKEIAAMQVAANAAASKDKLNRQSELEGAKIGADIAKHRAQMAVQRAQRAAQKQPNNPPKEKD